MALQAVVETLDSVDEGLKAFYEEKDGKFHLSVEGGEDTGALKRAKDHEKQARQVAETKASEIQSQLETLQAQIEAANDDSSRKNGDVEALDHSWNEKYNKLQSENETAIQGLQGNLKTLLVDNEAIKLASELAVEGSADLLIPHLRARLAVVQKDGKYVTSVNDATGNPSAATLAELKTEFANNPAFAPVIVGSKATGGGAGGGQNNGGSASKIDLATATPQERVAYLKDKRGT